MKFCLELAGYWPHHRNHIDNLIPEMMETAILADKLGFAAALIGEHHFMDFGATPDPFGLASYLAAVTEKMRLIVSVLQLPLWDVERLAGNIAQLDQLSRGRLEIGVGRGGGPFEPYRFNLPFDYESTRACYEARFDALKKLLTETDVTVQNDYVDFRDVTIMPPLLQKPLPPIWMASMRAESAYHMGKMGVHVMTGQLRNSMDFVKEVVSAYREGVKDAGLPPEQGRIGVLQWVYVAKDKADRDAKIELAYKKQQGFMGLLTNTSEVKAGRVTGIEIDGTPEDYAPSLVIGELDFVKERVMEFRDLGFDDFIVKPHCGPDHADVMTSLRTFGEEVMPLCESAPRESMDA
ncbi:LLM class flavin-dependent oxidoreductase [Phaeobacter sp. 22II1-1F12B]|uniref:LLM class flavin-dependent oxidoreductase n=1 Tax=Phaeobacter sp. 22II1-1F12B TaxID=1317111 RepID=UPI000B5278D4|nr:LLM class flavin-dependent oxidoreductase [Phaeobacter sp. 22II1-1F12B]OWU72779.1 hypothetical protein ATO1_21740 [Phaeobacter sp. 22II1-1F12B]